MRDRLFPCSRLGFEGIRPFPSKRFYCWALALLEGVLASFPQLADAIDVERIAWPRPRREVVDLIGAENQSLPVLLLGDDAAAGRETGCANGRRFVEGKGRHPARAGRQARRARSASGRTRRTRPRGPGFKAKADIRASRSGRKPGRDGSASRSRPRSAREPSGRGLLRRRSVPGAT